MQTDPQDSEEAAFPMQCVPLIQQTVSKPNRQSNHLPQIMELQYLITG